MSVHIGGPVAVGNLNPLFQAGNAQPKPAADYKASNGIMSGRELMTEMGGPPKSDVTLFGKTLKTNSVAYKEALGHLTAYQTALDGTKGRGVEGVPANVIAVLKDELQGVIDAADAYSAKHAGDNGKADRRGVMASLREMATTEMANLDKLDTLVNTAGKKVDVASGLALLRGGVTDCSEFSSTLNDDAVDKGASKDNFGSGKANTVSLLSYGGDMRVVKPINKTADKLMAGEASTGFDKDDMRTAARNTASSNVAEQLGIGSMIPKAAIVVHNGQAGLAMPLAKGESLIHKHDVPVTNANDIARFDNELSKGWLDNLKNYGVRKDDNGVWQKSTAGFKDIPYTGGGNPTLTADLQKNLLDLQVCDCLMGQMDRQPENIFIQISGNQAKVTGIDNDMCMGRLMTTLEAPREDLKSTSGGPPPLMSREMYTKLQGMSEDTFKAALGPEFTPAEVSAATTRLTLLKAHATKLEAAGLVVDNFQTWTGPDKAGKQVGVGEYLVGADLRSYVQRDAKTLSKSQPIPLDANKHV
jgi:hypothetical protein